jgi:hypothetical protein
MQAGLALERMGAAHFLMKRFSRVATKSHTTFSPDVDCVVDGQLQQTSLLA